MKFLPTMQNNRFCSKIRRRNSFIVYLHLAVKSILYQPKLLLFLFSSYLITHFASSSTTVPSQLVETESWVPHFFTVSNTIPGRFIVADCPAFSSSQHSGCHHNSGNFDRLCRAVAYDGCHRRDQGMSDYLLSVHTSHNSWS